MSADERITRLIEDQNALWDEVLPLLREERKRAVAEAAGLGPTGLWSSTGFKPAPTLGVEGLVRRIADPSEGPELYLKLVEAVADLCHVLQYGQFFTTLLRVPGSVSCTFSAQALTGDLAPETALESGRELIAAVQAQASSGQPEEPTAQTQQVVLERLREDLGEYVAEHLLKAALEKKGLKGSNLPTVIRRLKRKGHRIDSPPRDSADKGYRLTEFR